MPRSKSGDGRSTHLAAFGHAIQSTYIVCIFVIAMTNEDIAYVLICYIQFLHCLPSTRTQLMGRV